MQHRAKRRLDAASPAFSWLFRAIGTARKNYHGPDHVFAPSRFLQTIINETLRHEPVRPANPACGLCGRRARVVGSVWAA
jgi:hypothetical protein